MPKRLLIFHSKTLANSLVLRDYWLEGQPLWHLQFNVTGQSESIAEIFVVEFDIVNFTVHLHDLSFFHMR